MIGIWREEGKDLAIEESGNTTVKVSMAPLRHKGVKRQMSLLSF